MQNNDLTSHRGPRVECPDHRKACEPENISDYVKSLKKPLAVDLFCGAGGLSLGLQEAGFEVILGVDRDQNASTTHRSNFGGVSLCADLSQPEVVDEIASALRGVEVSLVAGGPPCQPFSRAGQSKIRSLIKNGDWSGDKRRELWHVFVDIVRHLEPKAVLVENVPDMAFGQNSIVLRNLVHALETLDYSVSSKILSVWHYGVPQHRQRLFLVGLREGLQFKWPRQAKSNTTIEDAISDMPVVRAGALTLERSYRGPRTPYQRRCRKGVKKKDTGKIFDHVVRRVRKDDLEAFKGMDSRTLYSDLPKRLRRYRSDIFKDKYKRLPWKGLSRTITAHIAKDGYWYIHPKQQRTLTVREAARIQSFPDRFRFHGYRTNAYKQIGEAVPPLAGKALGRSIIKALSTPGMSPQRPSTVTLAGLLKTWISSKSGKELAAPWRRKGKLWTILLGILLFGKSNPTTIRRHWPKCNRRWGNPKAFLRDNGCRAVLKELGKTGKLSVLRDLARSLSQDKKSLSRKKNGYSGLSSYQIKAALALAGKSSERPAMRSAVRVAERVFGENNGGFSTMKGELLLARLVGPDEPGDCYAAVLEIADRFCRPVIPSCEPCPLRKSCSSAGVRTNGRMGRTHLLE